jgi:hypothetical protein
MVLQDRGARMPRCSLWAPARLPEAWERLVQAASLMRARKVAAAPEAAEDDLSSPGAAELGQPTTGVRAKL